ncbi:hypothetical protein [uncultured Rikenella sp.]|uniref:hypothetical protein n=1 Tax=uncultured Rikenella sp. TaxID=368003 RepID=UPI00261266AF|nr:hypothetical protein [uncultured Rikenella sp.]
MFEVETLRVEAASKTPCGTAPGYRHYTSGTGGDGGNNGYSWSSIARGVGSLCLYFGGTVLGPSSTPGRAHGFQLRCLSE